LPNEEVVERWVETPYWRYFCGFQFFQHHPPIDPSSVTRWRKHIGPEGIETVLPATVNAIEVGAAKESNFERIEQWLRLSVIGSGVGVQIAELDRVFEPFRSVSSSFSRDHQGTGLGLSIARSLAQIQGDSLHLESQPGKGTPAVLNLPIADP
jgi:hypothetical protein